MPDDRKLVEVLLDQGMVTNQALATGPGLRESRNTRFLSDAPVGSVIRQPPPGESTAIPTDEDSGALALVPLGNSVAAVGKTCAYAYRKVPETFERKPSKLSSLYHAQSWSPMTATGGGVLWAGGPDETPMAQEACVQNGYIVAGFTYQSRTPSSHGGTLDRDMVSVLRIIDAETGEQALADVELATADNSGTNDGCCVLGCVPIIRSGIDYVAVWWGEYDHGTTSWDIKYREVRTEAALTVGSAVTAYSTTQRGSKCAVTQRVTGATLYTYIARNNDTDDHAELVRWDHDAAAADWTSKNASATLMVDPTVNGYGNEIAWHGIDIAVSGVAVCMTYLDKTKASSSVNYYRCNETDGLGPVTAEIFAQINAAVLFFHIGITVNRWTVSWGDAGDFVFSATPHAGDTYFGNATASGTHIAKVMTNYMVAGSAGTAHDTAWSMATCMRPFSPYHSGNDVQHQVYPIVPIQKAPRSYQATDNPNGYKGWSTGGGSVGTAIIDPSIELCGFQLANASVGALHPVCRIGVDRAIPTAMFSNAGYFLGRRAKPISHDGESFVCVYPADRETTNDTAANIRYAIVETTRPPAVVKTQQGVTYVGAGSVFTWDGEEMLESTPITVPRVRAVEDSTTTSGFAVGTYYVNAILRFKDAAGNVHRSKPQPADTAVAVSAGYTIDVFVEIPPATRDGNGLTLIGCEVYCSHTASSTTKVLAIHDFGGKPLGPYATTGGEYAFHLNTARIEEGNTVAWWSGGERVPDAPPSMVSLAMVNDRMWGVTGEEGRVRYTKWAVENQVAEWVATQEITIRGKSRPTAVSELDGRPLIFTKDEAWTVYGDGPNRNGVGSFTPPQKVADVGAVDPRLVLRAPTGVIFKSRCGWFILAPGGALAPWGMQVRDMLDGVGPYASAAQAAKFMALWGRHNEVRVGRHASTGGDLVYNWEADKWSMVDETIGGDFAVAGEDLFSLNTDFTVEHDRSQGTGGQLVKITTGWVRLSGHVEGNVSAYDVVFTAEKRGTHGLTIKVFDEYTGDTVRQTETWTSGDIDSAAEDTIYTVGFSIDNPHKRAFRFEIAETGATAGPATFYPQSLTINATVKPGLMQQMQNLVWK